MHIVHFCNSLMPYYNSIISPTDFVTLYDHELKCFANCIIFAMILILCKACTWLGNKVPCSESILYHLFICHHSLFGAKAVWVTNKSFHFLVRSTYIFSFKFKPTPTPCTPRISMHRNSKHPSLINILTDHTVYRRGVIMKVCHLW